MQTQFPHFPPYFQHQQSRQPFGIFELLKENFFSDATSNQGLHQTPNQPQDFTEGQLECSSEEQRSVEPKPNPKSKRGRRKLKKPRTSFTRLQVAILEQRFADQKYLASGDRQMLAAHLQMSDAQVKTWFQNRRTKWRRQEAVLRSEAQDFHFLPHSNNDNDEQ
ncbi:unnamed protein product, partial [Mesorhabditis spiculigera]